MFAAFGLVSLAWALSCLVLSSEAAPTYDPFVCADLKPVDPPKDSAPQVLPSPFKIKVHHDRYYPNNEVRVDLIATQGKSFRSFYIGAYAVPFRVKDNPRPVGIMTLLDPDKKYDVIPECQNPHGIDGHGLMSGDQKEKTHLKFTWTPKARYGHVEFRATFIEDNKTKIYWVSEKSVLVGDGDKPLPKDKMKRIQYINTNECGKSKACFREPEGCEEAQCTYVLTWADKGSGKIQFELGGLADGASDRYVAFGLSEDTYMGGDTVFTCAHNSATKTTETFAGYTESDPKKYVPVTKYAQKGNANSISQYSFMSDEEGSYENGRLRCRFSVNRNLDPQYKQLKPLVGKPPHLLFSHGYAKYGTPQRHGLGVEEYPLVSENRVDLNGVADYSGRASYPLAKAHGCLMIVAWILFASIGLILTKYYKTMWPNSRIFDSRYWFVGHTNCMAFCFIITIIGIILIFIEADGWSEAPDLPQKAHPILGIIIFVCIIINPILALLRPAEGSKCRPVFNWFHWAFGTIANVLAIPQIFIGMDFGKVQVPWWATWILVFWVIFHIVVELSLEIHQCCTYKKNKERRKKWEQIKREYPKQHHPEPEPAGRRFKRFMLSLHIGITILITLIMVIVIAVS